MRKYLKRKNKAVAFIAIALIVCSLCVLPCSAYDKTPILPDDNGRYAPLSELGENTVIEMKIDGLEIYGSPELENWIAWFDDYYYIGTVSNLRNEKYYDCQEEHNHVINGCYEWQLFPDEMIDSDFYVEGNGGYFEIFVVTADTQGGLITEMFTSFRGAIDGLTNGIKGMFNNILWIDGTSQSGLSHFAKFGFVMAGLSLALGLGYFIIRKIRA